MTERERKACEGLGAEMVRVIRDLGAAPGTFAYARKTVTFPDGKGGKGRVVFLACRSDEVADVAEAAIASRFEVTDSTPRSEVN